MSGLSKENLEAINALEINYREKIRAKKDSLEKMSTLNKLSNKNQRLKAQHEKYIPIYEAKLANLRINPEALRSNIEIKKAELAEARREIPYPTFDVNLYTTSKKLKDWNKQVLDYQEKYGTSVKKEDIDSFVDSFHAKYGLERTTIPENKIYLSLHAYLRFQENFQPIVRKLEEEFSSSYNLYVSVGSGGIMAQILPQDESFMKNVIEKQSKHLFLIFDDKDGWHEYKNLIEKDPTNAKGSLIHSLRTEPIQSFFGTQPEYKRLSEDAFQYSLTYKAHEISFVFLDSLFYPILLNNLHNLLKNASLKFYICGTSRLCDNSLVSEPDVINKFDYYLSNNYSFSPFFTELKPISYKRYNEKTGSLYELVEKPVNYKTHELRHLKIIDLHKLRNHIENKDLLNKSAFSMGNPTRFNLKKLNELGIPYKLKGNATFWNFFKGGKFKGDKTKRRRMRRRQTRKMH